MNDTLFDAAVSGLFAALFNLPVLIAVMRTELRHTKQSADDAHDRLNQINAPAARVRS